MKVERFPAVGPDDERITPLIEKVGKDPQNHYFRVTMACTLSHQDAWRKALEDGHERVMILEDDVRIHRKWKDIVGRQIEELDGKNESWKAIMVNAARSYLTWEATFKRAENDNLTGAYIVTKDGINKMLDRFGTTYTQSDHMTTWLQANDIVYVYFPWLAVQENYESDIQGKEHVKGLEDWFDKNFWSRYDDLYTQ